MRILLVEDEAPLRDGVVDLLRGEGHEAHATGDGRQGLELGLREPWDLVLLDVMLPGMDGMEVCRRLRSAKPALAILMLTARGSEDDKVRGLGEGADDYLTKPFAARELLARVRALGRRHQPVEHDVIRAGDLRLALGTLEGVVGSRSIELTAREAGIVRLLHARRPSAISRGELLERVWSAKAGLETRAVDMAIATLRKKIEDEPSKPRFIITVKGLGYRWGYE